MVDLLIDVDDNVIAGLQARAQREGKSLEQLAQEILTEAARRAELIDEIRQLRERIGPVSGDSTDLIREDRDNGCGRD